MNKATQTNYPSINDVTAIYEQYLEVLNKILTELRKTAEAQGTTQQYVSRIDDMEQRLMAVHDGISELIRYIPTSKQTKTDEEALNSPVILRIKNWEDYRAQCFQAQIVSFLCQTREKTFQVDCLKNGHLYTFSGALPKETGLLAVWLSRELKVEEKKVLEGTLELG